MMADDPGPAPEEVLPAAPASGADPARRPVTLARAAPFLPLLLAVVIFVPGLFGQFVWDDLMLIRGNAYVRDLSRLPEALTHDFWHVSTADQGLEPGNLYYRPVVTLAYAVQFQSFGEAPLGYHAVSLALHLLCVALAFVWLRRRVAAGPAGAAAALLGAALFAVHASRPESVSWVSGSTDLWMTALVLAGLLLWERTASRLSVAAAVLCFGLAVLAKETALVVPLLLFADAWLLRDAGPERARALRRAALPLLGVAAVFALRLALVPLRSAADAGGVGEALPRVLSTAGHYLRALLWPWPPSVEAAFVRFDAGGRRSTWAGAWRWVRPRCSAVWRC